MAGSEGAVMDSSREEPAPSRRPAPPGDPGDPPGVDRPARDGAARDAVLLSWLEVLISEGLLPGKLARWRLKRPF